MRIALGAAAATLAVGVFAAAGVSAAGEPELAPGALTVATFERGSGDFRAHNQLLANGAAIAVQQIGQAGGIGKKVKLTLIRAKLGSGNPQAVVDRLASRGVTAVVLPCGIDARPALAAAAARHRMLILAPCETRPPAGRRYPRYWPVGMTGDAQAAQLVGMVALANQGRRTAGYILSTGGSGYATAMNRNLKSALRAHRDPVRGVGTVRLADPTSVDALVPALKRLKGAIYTTLFSPYLEPVVARLRAKGVKNLIFATDGADVFTGLGHRNPEALRDMSFTTYGFARPTARPFQRDYQAAFGKAPTGSFPGLGFQTIRVLSAAVRKAASTDPAALDRALAGGLYVRGIALGDLTYPGRGKHEPIASVGVASIIRGAYTPLFETVPARVAPA